MRTSSRYWLLLVAAWGAPSASWAATQELSGVAPGGSAWRIAVPEGWTPGDGLVLQQHGYRFQRVTEPSLGPSAAQMLADGYAIAAPGYRQAGWAVFDAVADNAELLEIFRDRVGEPGSIIAHGGSMGALVALKLAETPELREQIDGVVALCPVVDGAGFWDRAFDLRIVYDALCGDVAGGALPRGSDAAPWLSPASVLAGAPSDPLQFASFLRAEPAIQACLGLHLPAQQRSDEMQQRVATLAAIAGTEDEEMLAVQLLHAHLGLAELMHSPDKLAGEQPFSNYLPLTRILDGSLEPAWVRYGQQAWTPDALDTSAARTRATAFSRLALTRPSTAEGTITTRLLAMHTAKDGVVPATSLALLNHRMTSAPRLAAVIEEAEATHCGFTQAEYDGAWRTLREWTERPAAEVPALSDLEARCRGFGDASDCRFGATATAEVLAQDPVEHPRRPALREPRYFGGEFIPTSGLFTDPARPGQGLFLEPLDDLPGEWREGEQRVAVSWYTWAPTDDPAPGPRWLYGVGRLLGRSVHVEQMLEVRGGRFGAGFDSDEIERVPWGSLQLEAIDDGSHRLRLRYAGPASWGAGDFEVGLTWSTGYNLEPPPPIVLDPPLPKLDYTAVGTYFDASRPAGGWVYSMGRPVGLDGRVEGLVLWFTWDAAGKPVWMFGIDPDVRDGVALSLQVPLAGGRFEPGYTQADLQFASWGTLEFVERTHCGTRGFIEAGWVPEQPGFEAGTEAVGRLTTASSAYTSPPCPAR